MRMQSSRVCHILFATAIGHSLLDAQTLARFDVASVRPNRTAGCRGRWDFAVSHRTLTAQNAPLLRIVSRAYRLTDDRVSGPGWLSSECYDIQAKSASDRPGDDLMPMLQTLLQERFHLTAHRESAERPILILSVDKGGSKLPPYGAKLFPPQADTEARILFVARHLPDLCERLGRETGRPVIDRTGLEGDYQIELRYLPPGSIGNDPSDASPDLLSAVRDQLGLKLEPRRGPVEILKIDSIDKVPTAN